MSTIEAQMKRIQGWSRWMLFPVQVDADILAFAFGNCLHATRSRTTTKTLFYLLNRNIIDLDPESLTH